MAMRVVRTRRVMRGVLMVEEEESGIVKGGFVGGLDWEGIV